MKEPKFQHWFKCSSPQLVRNKYTHELITVPCGHCDACKARKVLKNVPQIYNEAQCWKYCKFITLTYSNDYLPTINIKNYEVDTKYLPEFYNLCNQSKDYLEFCDFNLPVCKTSDLQKFIKRLRMAILRKLGVQSPIRYFLSFDYGGTSFRPHYHGAIMFSDERINEVFQDLLDFAWSDYNKRSQVRTSLGLVDCQDAYNCAKYIATYIQTSPDLPAIYQFRDFRPKSVHSSNPSFGSLIKTLESPEEIVRKGLTKFSVFNPQTFEYELQPLTPRLVYRLFPAFPSFDRLSASERNELYRIFDSVLYRDRPKRLAKLVLTIFHNSFFKDYLTYNQSLTLEQIERKLDTLYFTYKRLHLQASSFGYSIREYDLLIAQFRDNLVKSKFQFQYESLERYAKCEGNIDLDSVIDVAASSNARRTNRFLVDRPSEYNPAVRERSLFDDYHNQFTKLIKTKLNNEFLEKHPEYKQFHK